MTVNKTIYIVGDGFTSSALYVQNQKTFLCKSIKDFLTHYSPEKISVLLLFVDATNRESVEQSLQQLNQPFPRDVTVIVVKNKTNDRLAVNAIRLGAYDVLVKPDTKLLTLAIEKALDYDAKRLENRLLRNKTKKSFDSLTEHEKRIMEGVTNGKLNKTIAYEVGLAQTTVEIYRLHMMRKMRADSLPELVKLRLLIDNSQTSVYERAIKSQHP